MTKQQHPKYYSKKEVFNFLHSIFYIQLVYLTQKLLALAGAATTTTTTPSTATATATARSFW
jgi:hypothetical protein